MNKITLQGLIGLQFAGVLLFYPMISALDWFYNMMFVLFLVYLLIDLYLFIRKDALLKYCFCMVAFIILYFECILLPYFYFPFLIPTVFKSYWIVFTLGFLGIIIRHILLLKYSLLKTRFHNKQRYLQEGVVYMGSKIRNKQISIPYYSGGLFQKASKVIFDIACISCVYYVLHLGYKSIQSNAPNGFGETYIGICAFTAVAPLFSAVIPVMASNVILLFSAKSKFHKRFSFAGDDK